MPNAQFTDEQLSLFYDIVDASRRSRDEFYMLRCSGSDDFLQHDGFAGGRRNFLYGDAVIFQELNWLTVTHWGNHGEFHFVVSPFGLAAYEELHHAEGEAVVIAENDARRLIDADGFMQRHARAHDCWKCASDLLWTKNAEDRVTDIGHHCREAIQEFAESLLVAMSLVPEEADKQKTKNRLAQALVNARDSGKFGDTTMSVLNAMSEYWDAVSDLVMRQEHGATREGEPLRWDDARALVFHTLFVMTEFDRALS